MSTAFAGVAKRLQERLASDARLDGVHVHLGRSRPMGFDEPVAVNVSVLDAQASEDVIGCLTWDVALSVVCEARDTDDQSADQAVEALLEAVFERVSETDASDLGVIHIDKNLVIEWERDAADVNYAAASLRFFAVVRTRTTSLNAWD